MKKIVLSLTLLFTFSLAFSQSFMHGAGITVFVGTSKGGNVSYSEGFTYSPRFNFLEKEKMSVSVGIPLSFAISANLSTSYDPYYGGYTDNTSIGFVVNAPLMVSLNMGRGSTKENRQKFGYFVSGGFGYHHGEFLADAVDALGNSYIANESVNTYGPAANGGVRFGVGRKHKNIEVRLSYMKGINDTRPDIFSVAGLFNF
jgi:hypothetical protein